MTQTVEQAKKQRDEAHSKARSLGERAADLVRKLRGGDTSITASDLTAAEQEARHAGLVAQSFDGAVRKAERAEQQRRLDTALQTACDARAAWAATLVEHTAPVVEHLAELLAAAKSWNETIEKAHGTVKGIPAANVTVPDGILIGNGADGEHCTLPDGTVRVHADELLGELLSAAYRHAGLIQGGAVMPVSYFGGTSVRDLVHAHHARTPKYLPADAGQ